MMQARAAGDHAMGERSLRSGGRAASRSDFGASGPSWVARPDLGCCSDMVGLWRYLVFIILA